MGNSLEITDDFRKLAENINVNYKGSSFNPFKFHKNQNGVQVPVYFIGAPGLFTAIIATFISVLFMIMFKLNISFWVWLIVLLISAFLLRIGMKIDKARQIRYFCNDLLIRSYNFMTKYNESFDESLLIEINNQLGEILKFIEDEIIVKQRSIVENLINKKGA
jgi:uncharacterized protein YacL